MVLILEILKPEVLVEHQAQDFYMQVVMELRVITAVGLAVAAVVAVLVMAVPVAMQDHHQLPAQEVQEEFHHTQVVSVVLDIAVQEIILMVELELLPEVVVAVLLQPVVVVVAVIPVV